KPLSWKNSKNYQKTRARKATTERKLAEHRKSLHGELAHEIVALGNTIQLEKISYKAWQKNFGKSVGKTSSRDVCSTVEAPRCKHGRHPARIFHAENEIQPILPWMRHL